MRHRLLILLAASLLATQAQAIRFISTNTYALATGETLDDELWLRTVDAEVNGLVKDDLFLFADNHMALGGKFERNVWGMGNVIDLTGQVKHNVRLMGQTIQISGNVGGNILAIGDTIKVAPNAAIGGDIKLLGNSVILEGTTKGDVSITATRSVTISGTIEGNVDIIATAPCEIILQRDTRIGGDLTYTARKELVPAKGVVAGKLTRAIPQSAPTFSKARLLSHLIWFFAALLVGVPFISLFPMTIAMATQTVRTAPWKCLWVGALCALALPILGFLAVSSGIGLPLGALIFGGWGFMAYTSRIVMGLVIGTLVLRKNNTSMGHVVISMAVGLAIIYTATAIPAISLSVQITIISMGMGALLLGLFQRRRLLIQLPAESNPQNTNKNQEEK
jgi:cytoskeletal protein CcmA (bactofilin family)